jgi:hypothetical protein
MHEILQDTQPDGDLWLVAVNKRAAAFYLRHGFQHVRRDLLGHRMVLQRPRSDGELSSTSAVDVERPDRLIADGDRADRHTMSATQTPAASVMTRRGSHRHRHTDPRPSPAEPAQASACGLLELLPA